MSDATKGGGSNHLPLVLAVDIGTSSLRTALFTTDASRVAKTTAQQTYSLRYTGDGGAELTPRVLMSALERCLAATLQAHQKSSLLRRRPIVAAGTSCFWHSLMAVDRNNRPRSPIYTWADSRCEPDAARLRQELVERDIHQRTGCMLRASFWPAKLHWLQRTAPRLFSSAHRWVSPAEWLQTALCLEHHCAYGMATGTGLFDPQRLAWDDEVLARCDVSKDQLGPLSDEPLRLGPKRAREFPALQDTSWYPAIGDGAASNLGSGATGPGSAAINVGTSAALRVMREGELAQAPYGLFCYRVDQRRYLVGGAVSNAGNLRAWCLDNLNLPKTDAAIEAALARRAEPLHGLAVLPFLTAERAPTWRADLRGVITGLIQHSSALDILQATTEAVYYRLGRIKDLVVPAGDPPPKFIVSGGIHHSPALVQKLADVLNVRIHTSSEPEASLRGAAIFALEKLGWTPPAPAVAKAVRPRPRLARLHRLCQTEQQKLEELF